MSHVFGLGGIALSIVPAPQPKLDVLMLTGFLLAVAQLACYANRRTSRDLALGLCVTSLGLGVYAVAAGAWPLAMMQLALCASATLRLTRRLRSLHRRRSRRAFARRYRVQSPAVIPPSESRVQRLFGEQGSVN